MKKAIFFLSFLLSATIGKTQITHEATSSYYMLKQVDSAEFRYILIDKSATNPIISIYYLNHTLEKRITIPIKSGIRTVYNVSYISKSLFDCDSSNYEYLVELGQSKHGAGDNYIRVFGENGNILFKQDSAGLTGYSRFETFTPIVNTSQGTKFIVSHNKGYFKVYSLCGKLSTQSLKEESANNHLYAYPNPAQNTMTIEYRLPENNLLGSLEIYNINGSLIESFNIDNTFSNVLLDVSKYESGSYYYTIKSEGETISTKKFIKVN